MEFDDLMLITDEVLENKISEYKEKLFALYSKLNIPMLRFGIMSLSVHDKVYSKDNLLDMEDILHDLDIFRSILYSLGIEKSRRKRNEVL